MNYTKRQRKAIAQAFKNAKKHLSHGRLGDVRAQFICWAITGGKPSEKKTSAQQDAISIVSSRLGHCVTVGGYLLNAYDANPSFHQLQAYRHAWLDALIAEFEA